MADSVSAAPQDGDFDLEEGLHLLLQQEISRQKRSASVQAEGGSAADVNKTGAVEVLEHALSDFHHLPDDLELDENDIVDEICGDTGEELVSSIETALIKKVLDSGHAPCKNHIDDHMQAGLDAEDAVKEAVLNAEAGLGNFDDSNDGSNPQTGQTGDVGDDDDEADCDSDCLEPPGHLANV